MHKHWHLWLVDDDPVDRSIIIRHLKNRNYTIAEIDSGEKCIHLIQKELPDLILLDYQMPGLDGFETLLRMRACKKTSNIPIIMLTSFVDEKLIIDSLNVGANDFIDKSLSARILTARIEAGLRTKYLTDELEKQKNNCITESNKCKSMNKELIELNRLKSDFVSVVSHELRTPLAIIKEGISLCIDGIAGPLNETQRELLNDADENIDRLGRLINDFLDISKIEAKKIELNRKPSNLNNLIKKVTSNFQRISTEKGLQLNYNLPEYPIKLFIDEDKVISIFNNLIYNAIKFTDRGGTIIVEIEDEKKHVKCIVDDNGIGIAEEDIPFLFEKFRQFSRKDGEGARGTGLGLSIVKGLVERHGGKIWVESLKGRGTKFLFTLPKYSIEAVLKEHIENAIKKVSEEGCCLSMMKITIVNYKEIAADKNCPGWMIVMKNIKTLISVTLRNKKDTTCIYGQNEIILSLFCQDKVACELAVNRTFDIFKGVIKNGFFSNFGIKVKPVIKSIRIIYPEEAMDAEHLLQKLNEKELSDSAVLL